MQKFIKTEKFCWIGKSVCVPDQRRKTEVHYKSFSLGDLKIEVGDFVLVRNDDFVDPEDFSNCFVAHVKDLYDADTDSDVHNAKVQWFSRMSEIPAHLLKSLGEVDRYHEVVEEKRASWSDVIDAETIFNKCVVLYLPLDADFKLIVSSFDKEGIPTFFCRFNFNGYKFTPKVKDKEKTSLSQTENVPDIPLDSKTSRLSSKKNRNRKKSSKRKKDVYCATQTGSPNFPRVLIKKIDDRVFESQKGNVRILVAPPNAKSVEEVTNTLRKRLSLQSESSSSEDMKTSLCKRGPFIHSLSSCNGKLRQNNEPSKSVSNSENSANSDCNVFSEECGDSKDFDKLETHDKKEINQGEIGDFSNESTTVLDKTPKRDRPNSKRQTPKKINNAEDSSTSPSKKQKTIHSKLETKKKEVKDCTSILSESEKTKTSIKRLQKNSMRVLPNLSRTKKAKTPEKDAGLLAKSNVSATRSGRNVKRVNYSAPQSSRARSRSPTSRE